MNPHPFQNSRCRPHRPRPGQRGVTLVELVVAILIVAVLAAILFPAFGKVLRASRATACQGNLRQIGAGLTAYASDHGRTIPGYRDAKTWGELLAEWNPGFGSSQKNQSFNPVYRCPENRVQTRGVGAGTGETQTSYAINGYSSAANSTENRYTDQPVARLASPATLYAVTEGIYHRSEAQKESGADTVPANLYPGKGLDRARYPHEGMMNVLFADGHVERLPGPLAGRGPVVKPGNGSTAAATYANGLHWMAN